MTLLKHVFSMDGSQSVTDNIKIQEFRFLTTSDDSDARYTDWSRSYEYPAVINEIKKHFDHTDISIHNTACGDGGTLKAFKDDLLKLCSSFRESDSVSYVDGLDVYDITTPCPETYDVVLNISVLEHLRLQQQRAAVDNLMMQVKPGGMLLLTLDFPRVNQKFMEEKFGELFPRMSGSILNGNNARYPNAAYAHLNIILLVATKDS